MPPRRGRDQAIRERARTVIAGLALVMVLATGIAAATAEATGSPIPAGPHGTASPAATPGSVIEVEIEGFAYHPPSVTVPAGASVTWTNRDNAPHTVTGIGGGIPRSPGFGFGGTFTQVFAVPGTYDYYCAYHPGMKGAVVVK